MSGYRILLTILLAHMSMQAGLYAQTGKTNDYSIIPYPAFLEPAPGYFEISHETVLVIKKGAGVFKNEQSFLSSLLGDYLTTGPLEQKKDEVKNAIILKYDESITAKEGYTLAVSASQITLAAKDPAGIFYAIETLRQLLPANIENGKGTTLKVPCVKIADQPVFSWRGMMLDVSRHFFSIEYLQKYVDMMALYKMNTLHLHLTDDQGWRIEIKKYPQLTNQGAWREYNNQDSACIRMAKETGNPDMQMDEKHLITKDGKVLYGGFYTQKAMRAFIQYAAKRHVEIIPEIDMPGHMQAAVRLFPFLTCDSTISNGQGFSVPICPCNPDVLAFAKDIFSEIADLFPSKYIHIGGDEVEKSNWEKSAVCQEFMRQKGYTSLNQIQSYFNDEMQKYFRSKGKKLLGWDEIVEGGIDSAATMMFWRAWAPQMPQMAAKNHNKVVMSPDGPLYFDAIPDYRALGEVYQYDPLDTMYHMTPLEKRSILGVQANLWSEMVPTEGRADYLTMPRMTALSELGWTHRPQYDSYIQRLDAHYIRLDDLGINYRMPDLPNIINHQVFVGHTTYFVSPPSPYFSIHYSLDGSLPEIGSPIMTVPVLIDHSLTLKMALFTPNGHRGDVYTLTFEPKQYQAPIAQISELKDGLSCAYYKGRFDKTSKIYGTPDTVMYLGDALIPSNKKDFSFGLKYKGYIQVPETAVYTFYLRCNDGGVLQIDDDVVIDNDGFHGETIKGGQVALQKGLHKFALDFTEGGYGYSLELTYRKSDEKPQKVPASWFKTGSEALSFEALGDKFTHIPDTVQTSVYWYWLSDNISKEGVINDLEAMKKVGINRAFIGQEFIGDPVGKVKLFTDEWWDILHTALKTAARLHIDIGLFNGPGWSQSGGPWVKPELSMRYLASSELHVKGPQQLTVNLKKPGNNFQDVKVIAYPVFKDFYSDISHYEPKITIAPILDSLNKLTDRDEKTVVPLANGQKYTLDIQTSTPYPIRSLVIIPSKAIMNLQGEIQAGEINGSFKTIRQFTIDRSNDALNVGFNPYAPAAISLPKTTARKFRLLFSSNSPNSAIAELMLSSTPVLEDYAEKTEAKMWPNPYPYWQAYQWPVQNEVDDKKLVIDPEKVQDISREMTADGTLHWNVPAGDWVIERTGMLPTGVKNSPASVEGTGLETDKMSKEHIRAHFEAFLGQVMRRIPAADRKTWKVTVADSYETGGQNWSDQLVDKFKQRYGYDPTSFIPTMQGKVVGSADQSNRFLWDLRRFVADNVSYEYVGGLREVSHQYGLTTWLENYGHWGFPGEFLQYGGQSDEVAGEFWSEGDLGNIENRAASSAAHIYGKNKVSAESFTSGGPIFFRYPALMKQRADRFFTEGINNTLLHVYIQQPYEGNTTGLTTWFGNEFNRKNSWFYDMDIFLKYIKRCNMMLQQGKYVADVAYFISEDAPKMTGTQEPKLPAGYSFDYINGEVIKTRLKVVNHQLVLPDGMSYRLLVLPKMETMRPELLLKIRELVNQGAVVLGPRPTRSPSLENYPQADHKVQQLAADLWSNINGTTVKTHPFGKGMVIDGMSMQEALNLVKIRPDMSVPESDSVLFIHRQLKDGEIYFLSNQGNKTLHIKPRFRVVGKIPELWEAINGERRSLPSFTQTDSSTKVPIQLAPLESAFIIFRKDGSSVKGVKDNVEEKINYPLPSKTIRLTGPWQVTFDTISYGSSTPVVFNNLQDWSKSTDEKIKYYSGTAFYRQTIQLPAMHPGSHVLLQLGKVGVIAKVNVNGEDVGGVWTEPYVLDISKAVKPGNNKLEIKVVNTWVNRLIGDSSLPKEERKLHIISNPYSPSSPLQASGILGQVNLEIINY